MSTDSPWLYPLYPPILLFTFFLIFITFVISCFCAEYWGFKDELDTATAIGCFVVLENYCKNIDLLTFPIHLFLSEVE